MATLDDAITYDIIADLFLRYGVLVNPAFYDGQLSAELILHSRPFEQSFPEWLLNLSTVLQTEQWHDEQDVKILSQWYLQTRQSLQLEEMTYQPLLPNELFSLSEQFIGIQMWAQGFLEVLETQTQMQPELLQELSADLHQIAKMDQPQHLGAESEEDLLVLAEHLRLSALQFYAQMHVGQPQFNPPASDASLK